MEGLKYYTVECEAYDGMQGYAHVFAQDAENAQAIVREYGVDPATEPVERAIVPASGLTDIGKRLLKSECLCVREEGVLEITTKSKIAK